MSETGQRRERGVDSFCRMKAPQKIEIGPPPALAGLYHGWLIVGAAFVIAVFGFGIGFYGPGVYLVALRARYDWSAAQISSAITAYYLVGATLTFFAGAIFARLGARLVVAFGAIAMASGALMFALVEHLWQVYAAFLLMAPGWAAMSGAAINIIVAPWFEKRRGMAVGFAFNGSSAGGAIITPLLILMIHHFGYAAGLSFAAGLMLSVVLPVCALVLRPRRAGERDRADPDDDDWAPKLRSADRAPDDEEAPWALRPMLRSPRFLSISMAFALALLAQVGLLTHQIAYLSPLLGRVAAGWAVSLTVSAAVVGRTLTGLMVDRLDRRAVACGNLILQIVGVAVLAAGRNMPMLYLGCALFGLGAGNTTSLPSLIVHQEFPSRFFARIISLVVAINQFTFAFGPSLLGYLRQLTGGYGAALEACMAIEATAAIVVVLPVLARVPCNARS
jgi:MFS family permease